MVAGPFFVSSWTSHRVGPRRGPNREAESKEPMTPPLPPDPDGELPPAPVPADDPTAVEIEPAPAEASTPGEAPASSGTADPEADLPRMTLSEHLDELRGRLLKSVLAVVGAMVVSFAFYEEIWAFVQRPFVEAATDAGLKNPKLLVIGTGESFFQTLKLCFLAGIVGVAPYVLSQMWGFIAAGLYPHERRYVRIFFPVSVLLVALGIIAAYVLLIPFGLRFLITWDQQVGVTTSYTAKDYISTCLTMVFGMGLIFLLPIVMLFLQATDLVRRETFRKGWRVAVIISLVAGMFLTDPSPITQLMMAIPVVGLYFLGVWGGRFVGESAERFRWWKAWPLIAGIAVFVAMLVFSRQINDFAAGLFGYDKKPAAQEGTPEPGPAEEPEDGDSGSGEDDPAPGSGAPGDDSGG